MPISAVEDLRNDRLIPLGRNNEVNMRRPHWVTIEEIQKLSGRPVLRNWISSWPEAVEVVAALVVGVEAAAEVHVGLIGVLLFVQAVGGGVPDVDFDVGDGLSGRVIGYFAVHVGHVAALVFVDD